MPDAPSRTVVTTAAALIIGSELLSGKVREANLFDLAQTLRGAGIRLQRVVLLEDDVEVIIEAVNALRASFDVVFTSGGVGPTHDDVTIDAVARAFGVPSTIDPTVTALLREHYGELSSDVHLRMALVPEGAQLVTTADDPWPVVVMDNVWILPGVPEVFRVKLAVIRASLCGSGEFFCRAAFTRLDEAELKPLLDRIVADHPRVTVGSYPKWFNAQYKTQVTFDGSDPEPVESAHAAFVALIPPDQLVCSE